MSRITFPPSTKVIPPPQFFSTLSSLNQSKSTQRIRDPRTRNTRPTTHPKTSKNQTRLPQSHALKSPNTYQTPKIKSRLAESSSPAADLLMKTRSRGVLISATKLAFPAIFICCSLFFFAGFYGSILFSHDVSTDVGVKHRLRVLGEAEGDAEGFESMAYGETGESSVVDAPFQVLSWKPRALYFPRFATAKQCESIIKMARANLVPSTLALRKGETAENTKGIRTSSGTFISASEDKTGILAIIERKIARVTMIPRSHGESFNVLRYEIGQLYNCHYDAFNPAEYGPQRSQRIASFLLYLSDVEEGGETMFPFENGSNTDIGYDYKECIGLKVKPRQGDGLLFYSVLPNGTIDSTSIHGSCPVIKGEKWVATKWIHDQVDDG